MANTPLYQYLMSMGAIGPDKIHLVLSPHDAAEYELAQAKRDASHAQRQ